MAESLSAERLAAVRQALDDAVLKHTGRSIGDLASGQVLADIMPEIEALYHDLLTEARITAAAAIHQEGHRMMSHDRNATLHQLLTFIERKYGKDMLASYWSE